MTDENIEEIKVGGGYIFKGNKELLGFIQSLSYDELQTIIYAADNRMKAHIQDRTGRHLVIIPDPSMRYQYLVSTV